jgi:hypothetical protein
MPRALFVFAHGAGAGMHHSFMQSFAEALARRDIATLRWEFPYMRSGGRGRPDRPEVAEQAVRDAWAQATQRFPDVPRFAGGKSFGGRMTSRAHAAEPLADLRGLVFVGFPLHVPNRGDVPTDKTLASAADRGEHLPRATGPMLFLQGTRDELALLPLLRPVVELLGDRATLHIVDGADHGFNVARRTPAEVIDELGAIVAAWMIEVLTRGDTRR